MKKTRSYIKIGITGGIGSGKSFVCDRLEKRGIPVFNCDIVAKDIIRNDSEVQKQLEELIGKPVKDADGHFIKKDLAQYICSSHQNSLNVDRIVHPRVALAFSVWCDEQEQEKKTSGTQILVMECALLFESKFEQFVDRTVCVSTPLPLRCQRLMKRDGITLEQAKQWMSLQMSEEEKQSRSDIIINNDEGADIEAQVDKLIATYSNCMNIN